MCVIAKRLHDISRIQCFSRFKQQHTSFFMIEFNILSRQYAFEHSEEFLSRCVCKSIQFALLINLQLWDLDAVEWHRSSVADESFTTLCMLVSSEIARYCEINNIRIWARVFLEIWFEVFSRIWVWIFDTKFWSRHRKIDNRCWR